MELSPKAAAPDESVAIRRVDVPQREFAFDLGGRQISYLRIQPKRPEPLAAIEFVKGSDGTAPVVIAVTAEMP